MSTADLCGDDYASLMSDAINSIPEPAKVIARRIGEPVRSVENWKQRLCGPKGPALLKLCRAYPQVWDRIARAVEPMHEAEAQARLAAIKQRQAALRLRIQEQENRHGQRQAAAGLDGKAAARSAPDRL